MGDDYYSPYYNDILSYPRVSYPRRQMTKIASGIYFFTYAA